MDMVIISYFKKAWIHDNMSLQTCKNLAKHLNFPPTNLDVSSMTETIIISNID